MSLSTWELCGARKRSKADEFINDEILQPYTTDMHNDTRLSKLPLKLSKWPVVCCDRVGTQ